MFHTRYLCELHLEEQSFFQLSLCPLILRGAQQPRHRPHVGQVVLHVRLVKALHQKLPAQPETWLVEEDRTLARVPEAQFNRKTFGLSFGLKNHFSFDLRFPTLRKC